MSDNPAVQATQSLVTQIVSGYVKKNQVALADISTVINTVYQSLVSLGKAPEPTPQAPAVSIRQSVRPTYVVCLECGARGKMLRRHLRESHGLNPNEYRAKWGLSPGHPITAPGYSHARSAFAKQIGLGRKRTARRTRRQSRPAS
jgi:predicted transcriptional regulator